MYEMNGVFDIRRYKKNLRDRYKQIRTRLEPERRAEKDGKIKNRLISLPEYKDCKLILCYVSSKSEADTRDFIEAALSDGKEVAVPYCVRNSRDMEFYRTDSLDDLSAGAFGILEPEPLESKLVSDFADSICIIPGIVFDMEGYRLGYGGGYYDRFLSKRYSGTAIGVCYSECTITAIRRGRYDMGCDILVTDLFFKRMCLKKPKAPG